MTGVRVISARAPARTSVASATKVIACAGVAAGRREEGSRHRRRLRHRASYRFREHGRTHLAISPYPPADVGAVVAGQRRGSTPAGELLQSCHGASTTTTLTAKLAASRHRCCSSSGRTTAGTRTIPCVRTSDRQPTSAPSATARRILAAPDTRRSASNSDASSSARNNDSESSIVTNTSSGTLTAVTMPIATLHDLPPSRSRTSCAMSTALAARKPVFNSLNTITFAGKAGTIRHTSASSAG